MLLIIISFLTELFNQTWFKWVLDFLVCNTIMSSNFACLSGIWGSLPDKDRSF